MIEGFQEALALQEPSNFLKEVISSFSAKACVEFTTLTRIWLETPRITPFLFVTDGIEGLYTSIREWKTYVRAHPHLRIFLAMAVPIMKLFSDPTGFWRPPPPPRGPVSLQSAGRFLASRKFWKSPTTFRKFQTVIGSWSTGNGLQKDGNTLPST